MSHLIPLLLVSLGTASEHVVVHEGETLAGVAARLGDPGLAEVLRQVNGLGADAQPQPGDILLLPGGPEDLEHAHPAMVLSFAGEVTVTSPAGAAEPAELGMELSDGSIGVLDHDDVSLLDGTCLTLDATGSQPGRRSSLVTVASGSISVRTAEESPGAVTVRTSAGVTTGDGGGFRVTIEEGAARTEALHRPVSVMGAGQEVQLDAGQGSRTVEGEAPSDPVDLLLAGRLISPEPGVALVRPDFSWSAVEHALGYRVEIAGDADFAELLLAEEVEQASWTPELLFLPYRLPGLWWRVSSFDRIGFLGLPSQAQPLAIPPGMGP
jgi:hypothetical protein